MAILGPARPVVSCLRKKLVVHAALAVAVALSVLFEASPGLADTGIARNAERTVKASSPKRKVGASSGFGVRRDPINKRKDFHKGIDISRPSGTKVLAWSDGVVLKAGWMGDYGYTVDILHSNSVKTRYAHLRALHVSEGQTVNVGHVLGQVGRTGRTTGANLHFEVTIDNKLVDPRGHLPDPSLVVAPKDNQKS